MNKYILLLRGINVSGKNLIKMDSLKIIFNDLGFENVKTYLQSGNVIFSSKLNDIREIEKLIKSQIEKKLGLNVPVIVLTIKDLKSYIDNNSLIKNRDEKSLYFTFLSDKAINYNEEIIKNKITQNEEIEIREKVIYLYCPNGYGNTKLTNNFLEKNLKVIATTRNFKTTIELLKIAEEI
ncbi:MAG: DUF1697 domain-containing protein [Candidatus Sericytochromatia bacterium]